MSEKLAKWAALVARRTTEPAGKGKEHPREERKALNLMRRKADEAGSVLASGGEGGLPASLVYGVMKRDGFKCKRCGNLGTEENGLEVHHKGGIVESKKLSRKGHGNLISNIVTVCEKCHDAMHDQARDDGVDSSQVMPEGDVGTGRDRSNKE